MLRILIIDDEAPARNRLRRMLVDVPAVHVVGEAATGQEALNLIPVKEPDVLLLDISMPGLDGMALARTLQEQSAAPAIVFCTAWSDQAVEAFECDAVDYLVKPVPLSVMRWITWLSRYARNGSKRPWTRPDDLSPGARVRAVCFFVQPSAARSVYCRLKR